MSSFGPSTGMVVAAVGGLGGTIYGVYSGKPSVVVGSWLVSNGYFYAMEKKLPFPSWKEGFASLAILGGLTYWASKRGARASPMLNNSRARGRFPAAAVR